MRQIFNGFDQAQIAAQAEQHPMELHVAVEHRKQVAGIDRLAVFALYRLEPGDIGADTGSGRIRTAMTSSSSRTS